MQVHENERVPITSNITTWEVPRGSSAHTEAGDSQGLTTTDAANYGALHGYFIERLNHADIPRADAEAS